MGGYGQGQTCLSYDHKHMLNKKEKPGLWPAWAAASGGVGVWVCMVAHAASLVKQG